MPSFDQAKRELKVKIDKDTRSQQSHQSIIKRLKLEYNFNENLPVKKYAFKQVDESYLKNDYNAVGAKGKDKVIATFADQKLTVGQLLKNLEQNQRRVRKSNNLRKEVKNAYKTFVEAELIAFEKTQLESKYPEFRMLAREYYEGILLFDLTEKKVWKKSVTDTIGFRGVLCQ